MSTSLRAVSREHSMRVLRVIQVLARASFSSHGFHHLRLDRWPSRTRHTSAIRAALPTRGNNAWLCEDYLDWDGSCPHCFLRRTERAGHSVASALLGCVDNYFTE